MYRIWPTALCLAALMGGWAHAQVAATRPTTGAAADKPPAYANTKRVPIQLLEGDRRPSVILPREPGEPGERGDEEKLRSESVLGSVPPEAHRLPEGYVIGSRPARLERQGDWLVARLLPRSGMDAAPPLRLLPNQQLALIEMVLAETRKGTDFLLTGRVTEFQSTNYLLVEQIAQASAPVSEDRPTDGDVATRVADKAAPTQIKATSTNSSARDAVSAREPSAEEVIRKLMASKPIRAVVLPETPVAKADNGKKPSAGTVKTGQERDKTAASEQPTRWSEGTLLIDRLGRIVLGGDNWWTLAFENRGLNSKLKPIRLLPNRLLETALALSGGGTRGVVFEVSGEVTVYKNVHYLLLRKVLVRRDLGNFR